MGRYTSRRYVSFSANSSIRFSGSLSQVSVLSVIDCFSRRDSQNGGHTLRQTKPTVPDVFRCTARRGGVVTFDDVVAPDPFDDSCLTELVVCVSLLDLSVSPGKFVRQRVLVAIGENVGICVSDVDVDVIARHEELVVDTLGDDVLQ